MRIVRRGLMALALILFIIGIGLSLIACGSGSSSTPSPSPTPGGGNTYYVSTSGSDSNPGTREQPWKNPGYASRRLEPGDTLIILGGRYVLEEYDSDIIIPSSGRADAWITIKGEEGNRPILAGRGNLITAIDLSGKSYIIIENIEITSDNGALFREGIEAVNGPVEHVILRNLYIHHIDEYGIKMRDVNDLQIIDCRISYCGFGAIGSPDPSEGGWRNVLIQDCELTYSGHYYQGVIDNPDNPYDRPDGLGLEQSDGPIEIVNSIFAHNKGDGLDSKVKNTYVHECIIANNSCDGLKLWGSGSKVENCLIYGRGDGNSQATPWNPIVIDAEEANSTFEFINVTVDDEAGNQYIMGVNYDHRDVPITVVMRNVIFSGRGPNSPIFLSDGTTFTIDHCLFYMPNSSCVLVQGSNSYTSSQLSQLGDGNIYGDPMFVRTGFGSEGDYHLQSGSPAIDSGSSQDAPSIDLDGNSRPQGGGYDIGAYER